MFFNYFIIFQSENIEKYLKPNNSENTLGLSQINFDEDVFTDENINENVEEPENEFQKMLEGDDDDFLDLEF